jgi:hypothetical protein
MHGRHKIGVRYCPPLVIGDRHQGHLVETDIERLEVGKVLSTVKRCQNALGAQLTSLAAVIESALANRVTS